MRLVLDTNVVVSGMLWGGPPRRLLLAGQALDIHLFTSLALIGELTNTLSRKKFGERIAACRLTIDELIDGYVSLTQVVVPLRTPRVASDPDDDVVIGMAIGAKADLIVTGDRAFLAVSVFQGVRLVTVADALRAVRSTQSGGLM